MFGAAIHQSLFCQNVLTKNSSNIPLVKVSRYTVYTNNTYLYNYICVFNLQASGLDKSRNNWNKIDDFNWLSVTENSPNWTEIDNSERVKNWQET